MALNAHYNSISTFSLCLLIMINELHVTLFLARGRCQKEMLLRNT